MAELRSAVVHQMEAWAVATAPLPPSILKKRPRPDLHRRLLLLSDKKESEFLSRLKRLRTSALTRSDLPRSNAYWQAVFGGGSGAAAVPKSTAKYGKPK